MDWKECLSKRIVRLSKPDEEMLISLIQTSQNKLTSSDLLELNETTAASKLSLSYDSLRELLEALSVKRGYRIYNHECYTCFLKEIIGNKSMSEKFDRLRLIRNSVNYYGKNISIPDTQEAIAEIKSLIKEIKILLK